MTDATDVGSAAGVRILFVSPRSPREEPNGGAARWVQGLLDRGHEVTVVGPGPSAAPGARHVPVRPAARGPLAAAALEARLTAATLRAAAPRPGARGPAQPWTLAHVVLHAGSLGVPKALSALGIPVVLEVRAPLLEGGGLGAVVRRETLRAAIRSAAALVVSDAGLASHLEHTLGIRGARILDAGVDLVGLEPMPASDAKRELGLLDAQRFFALAAPLDERLALEPLMFAHRKVAGAGLLVAGSGPREDVIAAMSVATRPSSPVLLLEDRPEAVRRAIAAADVGLALDLRDPGPASLRYAALGRRQVAFDHPALERLDAAFPEETPVIRVPRPDAGLPDAPDTAPGTERLRAAMEAALAAHRALGPLSPGRVAAFRDAVGGRDPVDRLLATYAEVAPREGN